MRSTFAVLALLLLSSSASAQSLSVTVTPPAALGPEHRGDWRVVVRNLTDQEITDARLTFDTNIAQLLGTSPQLACAPPRNPVSLIEGCPLPPIAPGGTFEVLVALRLPFEFGTAGVQAFAFRSDLSERANHYVLHTYWKDFLVTSTADSGAGTLRQAILDINAQCAATPSSGLFTPCRAMFDITQKIGGDFFHTIELLSPLPTIDVQGSSIDATTEDQSNTLGPSVALDGSRLREGNGLTVARGTCAIRGLAIGNFPWNGIHALGTARVDVDRSYIGINALGMVPQPNGARGIASESVGGTIVDNVIAHNRRSGIYFAGPFNRGVEVARNRIVANGASGIYVGGNTRNYNFTYIRDNIITGNAHFGVAIDRGALVIVEPNSIYANGGGGIDVGLDGPTGGVEGIPARGGIYPPPVITSARYENGVTTISGTVTRAPGISTTFIDLYANDELEAAGFAEGKRFLAAVRADSGTFTVTLPRDLRGVYVNGLTRRGQSVPYDDILEISTSEFGRAMLVIE